MNSARSYPWKRGKARFGEPKIVPGFDWWDVTEFVRWNHLEPVPYPEPSMPEPRLYRIGARRRCRLSAAKRSFWKSRRR